DARAGHHHDGRAPYYNHAGIGTACAIGAAMETGSASAGGIGGAAEACDRACNQSCCEKILHVFSPSLKPLPTAAHHVSCRVIRHVKFLRHAETLCERSDGGLNP